MPERFTASRAERHMTCTASANLEAAIPNYTPPVVDPKAGAKSKGTDIHEAFEKTQGMTPKDLEHFITALQYLLELKQKRRFTELSEYRVLAEWLVSSPPVILDRVLYTQDEIHIIDWKTGRIAVDAIDNVQMKYYAVTVAHLAPKAKGVWVHIVQPWADNIDKVWIPASELIEFKKQALETEQRILNNDLTFGPSDKGCMFCPANPHSRGDKGHPYCPAMMQILYPAPELNLTELLEEE